MDRKSSDRSVTKIYEKGRGRLGRSAARGSWRLSISRAGLGLDRQALGVFNQLDSIVRPGQGRRCRSPCEHWPQITLL